MAVSAVQFLIRSVVLAGVAVWLGAASAKGAQDAPGAATQPPRDAGQGALDTAAIPPESWEGVACRLANSLVDPVAQAAEEPLFLPGATVRRFGRSDSQPPAVLRGQFDGWRVLGVQKFDHPGASLVADTAALLIRARAKDPQAVPEMLVRALTPRPAEAQAAEQTAARWTTSALVPSRGDKLALLLLWNPRDTQRPVFERLGFLLIKAGRLPDGRYRVQAVSYGTAQQAVLEGF